MLERLPQRLLLSPALVLAGLGARAAAQGSPFQTPGMPGTSVPGTPAPLGQTTRFSSEFNPAIGFVIDTLLDYYDYQDPALESGFDASLRLFEMTGAAWVDPKAFAYIVIAAQDDSESISVEEAAVNYVGLPADWNIKAGRFFVDFGKQMQIHIHDLRTVERPLVLRTYLGDELAGDGVEVGDWFAIGDETAVRFSLGMFGTSLLSPDEDLPNGPVAEVDQRQQLGDLNFSGRLTGFTDVGERSIAQIGGSVRYVPDYMGVDPAGLVPDLDGLENTVWGVDLTYGWTGETGLRRWAAGIEWLWNTGDTGISYDDPSAPTAIQAFDESVSGFYAWFDYGIDQFNSTGIQWSQVQLPEDGRPDASELDLYFTHGFSEFQRLRFEVQFGDDDSISDGEYVRAALQYTAYLGAHSHGINW